MTKCIQCGCTDRMLHRTKPKGQSDGGWTCLPCIQKTEPELAENVKQDYVENPILGDLETILNLRK